MQQTTMHAHRAASQRYLLVQRSLHTTSDASTLLRIRIVLPANHCARRCLRAPTASRNVARVGLPRPNDSRPLCILPGQVGRKARGPLLHPPGKLLKRPAAPLCTCTGNTSETPLEYVASALETCGGYFQKEVQSLQNNLQLLQDKRTARHGSLMTPLRRNYRAAVGGIRARHQSCLP